MQSEQCLRVLFLENSGGGVVRASHKAIMGMAFVDAEIAVEARWNRSRQIRICHLTCR